MGIIIACLLMGVSVFLLMNVAQDSQEAGDAKGKSIDTIVHSDAFAVAEVAHNILLERPEVDLTLVVTDKPQEVALSFVDPVTSTDVLNPVKVSSGNVFELKKTLAGGYDLIAFNDKGDKYKSEENYLLINVDTLEESHNTKEKAQEKVDEGVKIDALAIGQTIQQIVAEFPEVELTLVATDKSQELAVSFIDPVTREETLRTIPASAGTVFEIEIETVGRYNVIGFNENGKKYTSEKSFLVLNSATLKDRHITYTD